MLSDKPRRFKQSDCVTPVDPVTNSFLNSMRDNQTNVTHARLKETATRLLVNDQVSSFAHIPQQQPTLS